jgi:PilZ domain
MLFGISLMTNLLLSHVELHFEGWSGIGSGSLLCIGAMIAIVAALNKVGKPGTSFKTLTSSKSDLPAPSYLETTKPPVPNGQKTGVQNRAWPRWAGNPTPAMMRSLEGDTDPEEATVLNRSRGGMLLLAPQAFALRTKIFVRRRDVEEESWVQVEVRHCRRTSRGHLLGCKFVSGDQEMFLN